MTKTDSIKEKQIERSWHLIDAQNKILGRLASEVSQLLMGKKKPYFVRHLDCGDYVVVINTKDIVITGKKNKQKIYTRYSGYPGGLKKVSLENLKREKPQEVFGHAVLGMLPKNKLRKKMINRLYVFAEDKHPYQDKLKIKNAK